MELLNDLKAYGSRHKKILGACLALLVFMTLFFGYNYAIDRFNPQSHIDFTVYSPSGEQRSRQLVIENYMHLLPTVSRNVKVVTDDRYDIKSLITQQKSNGQPPSCAGEFAGECTIRYTSAGQEYAYTSRTYTNEWGDMREEWLHYKKDATDILIYRDTYADRAISEADWNAYVDSFREVPKNQLHSFFFVGDKQVYFGP